MCGIAGIWSESTDARARELVVGRMLGYLIDRGPDGERISHYGSLTIGFCRLHITGSAGLDQPSTDADVVSAVNGEIYNHAELREGFAAPQPVAGAWSDCDVVAPLAAKLGHAFVHRLDGIFAGVVFDRRCNRLILFRDHLGIKPLHYARHGGDLLFASSTAALALTVPSELNPVAFDDYLVNGYVTGPRTLLCGIEDVPAGSMVIFTSPGDVPRPARWFSLDDRDGVTYDLRSHVVESVQSEARLQGKTFSALSGGVDSTLVLMLTSQVAPDATAITVSYPDLPDDPDLRAAVRVASDLDVPIEHVRVTAGDYAAEMEGGWRFDQPLSDPNAVAFGLACRRVSDLGGRVLLGGDGSDELFCGYPYYRRGAWPVVGRVAAGRFTSMADAVDREFFRRVTGRRALRTWRIPRGDPVRMMQRLDLAGWLEANVLEKADRFGMANGVEVRVPFLRRALVRSALAMPGRDLVRGWDRGGKAVLRLAFSDLLPHYVVRRPKTGFACPIGPWLRGDLGRSIQERATWAIEDAWSVEEEQRLWEAHRGGEADWGQQLWRLEVARWWWRSLQ